MPIIRYITFENEQR